MRQILFLLLCLALPFTALSQTLKAKVYDSESTVKGIKVYNKTQNRITGTDENGDFSIIAKVNDTMAFESLFHHPKEVVVSEIHFGETVVFELEKIVNALDEVQIEAAPEQPVFTEESYNTELQNIILEDIKNNPHKYKPEQQSYGVNLLAIIDMVAKLLKRKDKYKAPVYYPITYEQLDSLTAKSSFFNDRLLTQNLKIPKDKKFLFFEFLEARQISSKLLKKNKKMELLEAMVQSSDLFLILLEEYGDKKEIKD